MSDGMHTEQYLKFRNTLTPASGFQSAQYRLIEFSSTDRENLIDARFRGSVTSETTDVEAFEKLYWQAAGKNHATGEKNTLIRLFEERYKNDFLRYMAEHRSINLYAKFKNLPAEAQADESLVAAMRHYDHTVNITWVMAHFHAAEKYLGSGDKAEGTGGSDWKKYMHPKYQRRIFFPGLWTDEEKKNWGVDV
jgi:tryptophan 2,3-dioxygenase